VPIQRPAAEETPPPTSKEQKVRTAPHVSRKSSDVQMPEIKALAENTRIVQPVRIVQYM
jgi:hypothetical protein